MKRSRLIQNLLNVILILGIIIVVNVISGFFNGQWDLTDDKRFTLTKPTIKLIEEEKEVIFVKVLLDGKFPSGFKRLQRSTQELLSKFNKLNAKIEFEFEDPLEGSVDIVNLKKNELAKDNIIPITLSYREGDEQTSKLVYPFAIVRRANRKVIVNLLEEQSPELTDEEELNNSVSILEYKFANAIQKLRGEEKPNILITEGNGELLEEQLASLTTELDKYYDVGRINLDSIFQIKKGADLLIVAGPRNTVSLKNQFKIDQYIMNGGSIIWLLEQMDVNLQQINEAKFFVPPMLETDLSNMLFKYGIRLQPNLILDMECSRIRSVVGQQGGRAQTELFPWFYHPLIASRSNHPIVKNIDRVNMRFPSTIDTVKTATDLKKTILLSSSEYSRFQMHPMRLNFEILKYPPDAKKFNKGPQPVAVLVEGKFESFFKNRVTQGMEESLKEIGSAYSDLSVPTKQLFVSDADFIKNLYDVNSSRVSPLGYNNFEEHVFKGNLSFILNAVEYMLDQNGVLAARSKEVKLRLLDKVKAKEERLKWQLLNIVLPLAILAIFGLTNFWYRRKKYAQKEQQS